MGENVGNASEVIAWTVAVVAVLGLLGALASIWVGVKTDIAALQVTVTSLDRQLTVMARSQIRIENLLWPSKGNGSM